MEIPLNNITSFTNFPMQIVTGLGVIFLVFAVVLGVQSLVRFFSGTAQEGFTTVYLVILLSSSMIMIGLGVIGYYMSKIYEEIKFRPRYIISVDTKDKERKDKIRTDGENG